LGKSILLALSSASAITLRLICSAV
jgi:hypothetical protein